VAGGLQEAKVLRVMGVASSMNLNQDDPHAPINRRISIVVLNQRAQMQIETANATTTAGAVLNSSATQKKPAAQTTVVGPPAVPTGGRSS